MLKIAKWMLLLMLPILPSMSSVHAEKKMIEADGYYVMGDGPEENQAVAKDRARADAKRVASEQARVFVETISEMKNGKLTRDEIRTVSANVLEIKTENIEMKVLAGTAVQYRCHITALVDVDNVVDQIKPKDREKFQEAVRRNKELELENDRLNSELASLKQKFKTASEPEREKINVEIKRNESKFTTAQWVEKASEYSNQKNFSKAIDCYNEALKLDSNYAPALNGLGWVYQSKHEYDKAVEHFNRALAIDGNYASSWNGLGYASNYKGEYDKAIEYCQRAIDSDPNYAAPWNNLGYAYNHSGNSRRAIDCYYKATELDSQDSAPWSNLGNVYASLGNNDKAIESCQHALDIDPDSSVVKKRRRSMQITRRHGTLSALHTIKARNSIKRLIVAKKLSSLIQITRMHGTISVMHMEDLDNSNSPSKLIKRQLNLHRMLKTTGRI